MNLRKKYCFVKMISVVVMVLVACLILLPLFKMLVLSLSEEAPTGLDFYQESLFFDMYKTHFESEYIVQITKNSLFVTLVGSALGTTVSVLGGYVLAQKELPGRNFLSGLVFGTLVFDAGMIPTYLAVEKLGLINTLWAVVLTGTVNVFCIFYLKSTFEGMPKNLVDAAKMDGAGSWDIFLKIVLPVTKPAISTVALMYAVKFWNDYANYRIYITKDILFNWQMRVRSSLEFLDMHVCGAGKYAAEASLSVKVMLLMIPTLIFVFIFNKYLNQVMELGKEKE